MEITLNDETISLDSQSSIDELIKSMGLHGKFAVEINQNIVPKSEYVTTILYPGDNIEIVQAVGGG